ncbi:alpha/beta hydrolase [Insolitispirillum peregrinum]
MRNASITPSFLTLESFAMSSPSPVLIVPGLGGSGADHWQAHLARALNARWLEQTDWDTPSPVQWEQALAAALSGSTEPVTLVAHSLGCILSVRWVLTHPEEARRRVNGVLLVAPADVDSPSHTPSVVHSFAPIPLHTLPIPSVVVASQTDPYCSFARARQFAGQWGSDLIDLGDAGHINVAAGYGPWPLAQTLCETWHTTRPACVRSDATVHDSCETESWSAAPHLAGASRPQTPFL